MARKRFCPMALVASSDYGKYKAARDMQPVRFTIIIKWYTVVFGQEIEITAKEASRLGDLAFSKRFKKRV